MNNLIYFHMSGYRDFKSYYTKHVLKQLRPESPKRVSYHRFVELMLKVLLPLGLYLHTRFGPVTGISFMDATPLPVCHNRRIKRREVFAGLAARGNTSGIKGHRDTYRDAMYLCGTGAFRQPCREYFQAVQ